MARVFAIMDGRAYSEGGLPWAGFPTQGCSLLGTTTAPRNADRHRDRYGDNDHSGDSNADVQHWAPPFRLNAGVPARFPPGPVRSDATCTSFRTSACGIAIITGFSGIDWQQMFKIKAQTKATGRGRRMLARLPDSFSTI